MASKFIRFFFLNIILNCFCSISKIWLCYEISPVTGYKIVLSSISLQIIYFHHLPFLKDSLEVRSLSKISKKIFEKWFLFQNVKIQLTRKVRILNGCNHLSNSSSRLIKVLFPSAMLRTRESFCSSSWGFSFLTTIPSSWASRPNTNVYTKQNTLKSNSSNTTKLDLLHLCF